jgi:hypothetical protein
VITPNKFVSYEKSILSKLEAFLKNSTSEIKIIDLYNYMQKKKVFDSPEEFILTLDALHVLGKINVNFDKRTIQSVIRNH